MKVQVFLEKLSGWALTNGLHIVAIFILTLVVLKAAKVISGKVISFVVTYRDDQEFQKRAQTLGSITRYTLSVFVLCVAFMMVLKELGIDIGPVLAAAGIVGLAVGFGAQSLVKDVITGFFILLEDQVRVGDVVEIAGKRGLVEKVHLRTTVLRDLEGNVHYVPNGQIETVTNMTKDYSRYVFDIGVAYREDVDEVIALLKEVDEELRKDPEFRDDILEPMEVLGLDQFADSAVIIKARTKTLPMKQWGVGREFNRRIKKKFDERNIEIPFPHVTLYAGQDKAGHAPPFQVGTGGKGGYLMKEGGNRTD